MERKYAISEFQKPLQACRRLLQLPQFYYPVQDKGQNARRVVLKSFIAIAIEKIMLQSLLLEGTNALAQIMQTVLDREIDPVQDRLVRNYIPCLGQRGRKPYPVQGHIPVQAI